MSICTSIVLVMTISTFKKLVPRLVLVVKPLQSLPQPVASDCVHHLQNQWCPGERKKPWRNFTNWGPVGSGPVDSLVSLSTVLRRPETGESKKKRRRLIATLHILRALLQLKITFWIKRLHTLQSLFPTSSQTTSSFA